MAKIIINRSSEYSNKMRLIGIYLASRKIGEVKDGQSAEFEVHPGDYLLCAKIDWCKSNNLQIQLKENDTLRFNLSGRNPFLALYYITIGRNDYLQLKAIE